MSEKADGADGLVAGDRLTISIADHILRCARLLEDEQAKINPDNALIDCLCESVRLAREHVHVVRSSGGGGGGTESSQSCGDLGKSGPVAGGESVATAPNSEFPRLPLHRPLNPAEEVKRKP